MLLKKNKIPPTFFVTNQKTKIKQKNINKKFSFIKINTKNN